MPLLEAAARASEIDGIPAAGARSLCDFAERMARFREAQVDSSARHALEGCVKSFGLATALAEEEDGADRLENVGELLATASSFDSAEVDDPAEDASDLELYLQTVALRSEIDDVDFDGDAVTLMTLHNAKGLEFPVVFLAGLEEGLFPLSRALESEGGIEEERRLFYVGVTRAMDRLHLTYADRRWRAGTESRSSPSSFLDELPQGPIQRRLAGGAFGRSKRSSGDLKMRGDSGEGAGAYDWRRNVRRGTSSRVSVPTEPDELRYDYSDSQERLELEPGARIVHPRFGEGRVLAVSGAGRGAKAEIEFEGVGTKKVIVAYAGLRPA